MTVPVPRFLAIDIETTGLDPSRCRIIEVGMAVLTEDLHILHRYETIVDQPDAAIQATDPYVVRMHLASGLFVGHEKSWALAERSAAGPRKNPVDVERDLISWARIFPQKPTLFGSSVDFDRSFLRHWMPDFAGLLHYRVCDVSSNRTSFPHLPWPKQDPSTEHRALADIFHSIEELRFARRRAQ